LTSGNTQVNSSNPFFSLSFFKYRL
jgi:hypothetical protein